MIKYSLDQLIARSSDRTFEETALFFTLESLPSVSEEGPWLAGGSLRRILLGQDALGGDVDFFFKDQAQYEAWCKEMENSHEARKLGETDHAISYEVVVGTSSPISEGRDPDGQLNGVEFDVIPSKEVIKVQGIKFRYYDNLEAVLDSFDFTICQLGYDGSFLVAGDYTLWDLARKRLALHKLSFGVSTVRRLLKYTSQGFTACSGVITAILNEVSKNPETIQSKVLYLD